jgi:Protein of unknown function (DUF2911)
VSLFIVILIQLFFNFKAVFNMKKLFILSVFALFATSISAQKEAKAVASPAAVATGKIGAATVTINYAQPAVKGREIWGGLVPYDQVWRTGANGATIFEIDKDVTIEGKALKAGKYGLFSIPTKKGEWTIIFNSDSKQWGAYDYSAKKDVLRVNVKSSKTEAITERMTFEVAVSEVVLSWEKLKVAFKVK